MTTDELRRHFDEVWLVDTGKLRIRRIAKLTQPNSDYDWFMDAARGEYVSPDKCRKTEAEANQALLDHLNCIIPLRRARLLKLQRKYIEFALKAGLSDLQASCSSIEVTFNIAPKDIHVDCSNATISEEL